MIIDIHTHTFPDKLAATTIPKLELMSHTKSYVDGTNGGLMASMAKAGVNYSVVLPVATSPKQVVHINDSSARINEQFEQTGIFSFGCIHPDYDDYRAELARVKDLGLKGIKLHPVYQDVNFDDIRTLRILDRAAELGLIVLTHSGLDVGFPGRVRVTPAMVQHAVKEVGPLTLILAHMGGWRNWDEAEQLLADAPVYLDTSPWARSMLWMTATTSRRICPCSARSSSCAWYAPSVPTASSSAPTAPGAISLRAWNASVPCPSQRRRRPVFWVETPRSS